MAFLLRRRNELSKVMNMGRSILQVNTTTIKDLRTRITRPKILHFTSSAIKNGDITKEVWAKSDLENRTKVTTVKLDLDLPPRHRWSNIVLERKTGIINFINYLKHVIPSVITSLVFRVLGNAISKVPYPYNEEIIGIAETLEVPVGDILACNIFYELEKFCTSIVTQDQFGNVFHGRNLDLGAWMGWDKKAHTWEIEELLHPLTVNVEFQTGGTTLFKTVQFAGTVGVFTGIVPGQFSFSLNSRSFNGLLTGPKSVMSWLFFAKFEKHFASLLSRDVLQRAKSYEEAERMLSNTPLLAPVYYILGGAKPNQGVIISRSTDKSEKPLLLNLDNPYVVQTNYDHWKKPPFYDDRRKPAKVCMRKFTSASGNKKNYPEILFNVLSTIPVKNKATVYTAIMSARLGLLEAYQQTCPGACYPW